VPEAHMRCGQTVQSAAAMAYHAERQCTGIMNTTGPARVLHG